MGIIISGIDMPTNCTQCPCSDDGARFCRAANEYIPMLGKPNFCPLVEAEERKTGKWLRITSDVIYWYECSECHGRPLLNEWHKQSELSPYCPHCGSYNGGEQP